MGAQLLIHGQQAPRLTIRNENPNSVSSRGDPDISAGAQGSLAPTAASAGCGEGEVALTDLTVLMKAGMLTVSVLYIVCQHEGLNNSGWLSQMTDVAVSQLFEVFIVLLIFHFSGNGVVRRHSH